MGRNSKTSMHLSWDKCGIPRPLHIRKKKGGGGRDRNTLVISNSSSATKTQKETKQETSHLKIYLILTRLGCSTLSTHFSLRFRFAMLCKKNHGWNYKVDLFNECRKFISGKHI